jgi:hypothetical protein
MNQAPTVFEIKENEMRSHFLVSRINVYNSDFYDRSVVSSMWLLVMDFQTYCTYNLSEFE